MLIFIAIAVLAVTIVILLIKYFCSYAKLTSHDSFNREAKKQVGKIEYSDPKITCDFCGASIDTRKDKVCPACGAEYGTDKEWKNRHDIDQKWIDDSAEATADKEISAAHARAAAIAKKLKSAIIILASILGVLIIVSVLTHLTSVGGRFLKSTDVNKATYEHYLPETYAVTGNNTIIDIPEMRISITGFYRDDEDDRIKIEYTIENLSDEHLRLKLCRLCVNNRNDIRDSLYIYDVIKRNSTVVTYDTVRYCPEEEIKTLSYYNSYVAVEDSNDVIYEMTTPVRFTTDSSTVVTDWCPNGSVVFEGNGITIINIARESEYDNSVRVAIINDTDYDFTTSDKKAKINGEAQDSYGLYNESLPAHSMLVSGSIINYGYRLKETDLFETSFSFNCTEFPSVDFSTDFITLK